MEIAEVAFKHHFSNNLISNIVHPDTMIEGEEASVASAQFLRCRREPHVSASYLLLSRHLLITCMSYRITRPAIKP
jgi:hypothetical protein